MRVPGSASSKGSWPFATACPAGVACGGGWGGISAVAIAGCDDDVVKVEIEFGFSVCVRARYFHGRIGEFGAGEDAVPVHLVDSPFVCCLYRFQVRQVEGCHHVSKRFEAGCEWNDIGRKVGFSGVVNRVDQKVIPLSKGFDRCEYEGDCSCFVRDKVSLDTLSFARLCRRAEWWKRRVGRQLSRG